MSSPFTTAKSLGEQTLKLKRRAIERDHRMMTLQLVRQGKPEALFPDLFSDTWKKSIVANWIDSVALEFAEMIAPLPALNCASRAMNTTADKVKAAKRNVIGSHYWRESNLKTHMVQFADAYLSFGFAAMMAEPDYEAGAPRIRVLPSIGTYYDNDRFGNTLRLAHCTRETVDQVASMFPALAPVIRTKVGPFGQREVCSGDEKIEVVQWVDADRHVLFLPERENLVLVEYDTLTDKCPAAVAERPNLWGEPAGQYDQVVWVQLARHRMAMLGLEVGVKAAGAPIAVPRDVAELAVGPDAVIVTDSPEKVRRVGIEVPNSTFALQETLESELRMGARYPEGRAGGIDASVITGRGVEALMGSFDTQISTAQTQIGECLAKVTAFAFELDAKVWPTRKKRITGTRQGEAYDLTYVPKTAIGDSFACDVSYGFAAGLAPNAATVMMLQLRGDGLVDRDTVRRNLPFDIDVEQMQRNLDVEQTADAMKQGLFALLAGLGPMAAQGLDPLPFLRSAAEIIKGRQNGRELQDLFIEAFAPEVMDPEAVKAAAEAEADGQDPAGGGALPGQDPNSGLPTGVVPGQAGQAPGGAPDLQTLIAGLRGGKPQLDAAVSRRLPTA